MVSNLFFLIFAGTFALAGTGREQCGPQHFEGRFGPVRHQGVGWCFAFVAADLIGEKMKLMPPQQVSAFDVGSNYYSSDFSSSAEQIIADHPEALKELKKSKEDTKREIIDDLRGFSSPGAHLWQIAGGVEQYSITNYAQRHGACLEAKLPSSETDQALLVHQGVVTPEKMGEAILLHQTRIDSNHPDMPFGTSVIESQARELEERSGLVQFFAEQHQSQQKSNPLVEIVEAGTCLSKPHFVDNNFSKLNYPLHRLALQKLDEVIDKKCGRRIPFERMDVIRNQVAPGQSGAALLEGLNKALSAGRPVSVSYDIGMLSGAPPPMTGVHISTVEARQWNEEKNECEYKIRNSFGVNGCDAISNSHIDKQKCKDGEFWVGEGELSSRLVETTYIP